MADPEDPTKPIPEEPKTDEPESMPPPAESSEGETTTVAGEEGPGDVVSKQTGPKPSTPEAKPAVKPVKKAAKNKKEAPKPVAAAAESHSLSAQGEKREVLKPQGQ